LETVTNSYNDSDKYTPFEKQTSAWPILCVCQYLQTLAADLS